MHWSDKVEVGRTSSHRLPNHTSRIFQLSHQLPLITLYHLYKDSKHHTIDSYAKCGRCIRVKNGLEM